MKQIKIKSLRLENFKCHKFLILNFEGGNASIYGDNATGKSSVYDAVTWLLFGKDSKGNGEKNIEIKPLDEQGEVRDHLAETAVEAVLLVDGEQITLRRTLKEVWSNKRGSAEATYDGNTSEYYVDGVPCKKYVFTEKVEDLVDEDTFRLLTSVTHFADGISWQDRRAVLFRVAAVVGDDEIMATDTRFKPLVDGKGRLTVDDYKKKLVAEKRGFVGAKTEIPARISECQKTIEDVEGIDFERAKATVEILNIKRESAEKQLLSLEHDALSEAKRMDIREARLELDRLNAENMAYISRQMASMPDTTSIKNNISRLELQVSSKNKLIDTHKASIGVYDKKIAESRERWIAVNAEAFTGGNCPTCGQALPAKQMSDAMSKFEADKAVRLREIEQTANAIKEGKAQTERYIAELTKGIADVEKEIAEAQKALKTAQAAVTAPVDMDGYTERRTAAEEKIRALEIELADMVQSSAGIKSELMAQISAIKTETDAQREIISREALLEYSKKRVDELHEETRAAAASLDAIEQMLYLIEEYTRYKTQFVEDSINSMFRIARFRLFREQANGGIEDRCDVVYDGVPYINVNSGAKINVGIDIINTLSRAYGVTVPLFVDNAESVTHLEQSDNQIIRLVVSEKDKELRVNYEN